jgi:hypothetical protein
VDQANMLFYELKPISHQRADATTQAADQYQLAQYSRALAPHGFRRGLSEDFVTPGTPIGSFAHNGKQYTVILYPADEITSAGFSGDGLIYYDLREGNSSRKLFRNVPVELLVTIPISIARPVATALSTGIETRVQASTLTHGW